MISWSTQNILVVGLDNLSHDSPLSKLLYVSLGLHDIQHRLLLIPQPLLICQVDIYFLIEMLIFMFS